MRHRLCEIQGPQWGEKIMSMSLNKLSLVNLSSQMERHWIYFSNAAWEKSRVSSLKWDAKLVGSFTAE